MTTMTLLRSAGLALSLAVGLARAEGGGPSVTHAPVTTAIRGVPVNITATIEGAPGSSVTSAVVLVRLSDAGTPIRTAMAGGSDGAYTAVLPVTMIRSVSVFWYAIDSRDEQGQIGGTPWVRVVIADPISSEGAAGAATEKSWKTAGLIGGGLLAAGGAVAIIAAQDDDDDGNNQPAPTVATPPPTKSNTPPPANDGGGDRESPDLSVLTNIVCQLTGRESVSYENLSRCDGTADILILVCNTCLNTDIRASTSWNEEDVIVDYSNVGCNVEAPRLRIRKPLTNFPTPGSETINVFVNNVLVDSVVWPPLSDFDCF